MRIDAHQHFWQPARGDYFWMPKDHPILSRPYMPADLASDLAACGIDATILVQAAASVAESDYMLGLADATPFIAGVVGWVDFDRPDDREILRRLAGHPKFKGVRPMIQDIADDNWMLGEGVQWGFRALADLGLTFDALGFPRHLPNFLTILKRHPDLKVVIDHGMKPQIASHDPAAFTQWADGIARIADETTAFCKLSGLLTEAGPGWSVDRLQPYADHILRCCGPARVMWGSDWPVCRLVAEYADWYHTARQMTDGLGAQSEARIFGGTAAEFYGLSV
jgi:L-fuconolactonase